MTEGEPEGQVEVCETVFELRGIDSTNSPSVERTIALPTPLVTDIDVFFELLKDRQEIPLGEIADLLGKDVDLVERWSFMLKDVEMLSMYYPTFSNDKRKVRLRFIRDDCMPKSNGGQFSQSMFVRKYHK